MDKVQLTTKHGYVVGQRVRMVATVYEEPSGDSPGGIYAMRDEILIVRSFSNRLIEHDIYISHEYRTDNSFVVSQDEITPTIL